MCKQDSKIIFDFIQNESNILQADVNVFHIDPQQNFDQKRQTSSNIFPNVLLADFSSLELRDICHHQGVMTDVTMRNTITCTNIGSSGTW